MSSKSNVKVNITTDFDSAGAKAAERELRRVAQQQIRASNEMAAAEAQAAAQRRQALGTVSNAMGALGLAMTAAAAVAVTVSARFDAAMSNVGATGIDRLGDLREAAMQAGRDTAFSAIEAAEGIEQLAKAGVAADDVLSGGLTATLDLAAAGQLSVARAAEITAVTLKQFGLAGQDATKVADLLAAGANKAVGGVEELAQGLEYVGPVAAQLGVSVETTTGVLAMFAEQGILGSKAGTGLRGVLMSMTAPSAAAARAMEEYGISVFDARGEFVGLEAVAGQLHDRLGPLDEATRSAALGQIFGNEQITAARILYQGGAGAVREWTDAVDESGYAAQVAADRLDNLQGDVKILQGSIETMLISMGEAGQGPLRSLTQGATGVVNALAEMPPAAQGALLAIVGGGGLVALGGAGLVKLVNMVAELRVALVTLGVSAKTAGLAIGGILGGIGLVTGAVLMFAQAQQEARAEAKELADTLDEVSGALTETSRKWMFDQASQKGYIDAANQVGVSVATLVDAMMGVPEAADEVRAALDEARAGTGTAGYSWEQLGNAIGYGEEKINAAEEAWRNERDAMEGATDAAGDSESAHRGAAQAIADQVVALEDLIKAQQEAAGVVLSARDATRNLEAAYDDATAAVEKNGATLDVTTEKGRDNQAALDDIAKSSWDLIDAMEKNGAESSVLQDEMRRMRERFLGAAQAMGMSADDANRLADELNLIPENVKTQVIVQQEAARAQVEGFLAALNRIPTSKTVTIFNRTYDVASGLATTRVQGQQLAQADGGVVRYYGSGGMESHVAQIAPAGSWRVWGEPETGGEAYIPLAPSKRSRSLDIWAETGRLLGVDGGGRGGPVALDGATLTTLIQGIAAAVVGGIDRGIYSSQRAQRIAGY